jgi:hypothetical protein
MFSVGKVDNAVITLKTGDKLNGQLRGTTTGGQENAIRLLSGGRILSVAMREIANIECAVPELTVLKMALGRDSDSTSDVLPIGNRPVLSIRVPRPTQ